MNIVQGQDLLYTLCIAVVLVDGFKHPILVSSGVWNCFLI